MRREVASLTVALALAGGASLAATPVRFDVSLSEPAKGGAAPVKVALRLEEVGAGFRAPRVIEREVQAPASVNVELPAGAAWRLTARGEGVWSPPQPLSADQVKCGAPAAVLLFPAGIVRGRLEAVARERPPALRERRSTPRRNTSGGALRDGDGPALRRPQPCPGRPGARAVAPRRRPRHQGEPGLEA